MNPPRPDTALLGERGGVEIAGRYKEAVLKTAADSL